MLNKLGWAFASLYIGLSLYLYLINEIILIELLMYTLLIVAGLLFLRFKKTSSLIIVLIGLCALPHFVGLIPFNFDGRVSTLYDDSFIIANYDLISHTLGFLLLTLGFLFYKRPADLLLIFLAMLGIGLLVEISEFIGYLVFGIGKGWLMFGASDSSINHGPWGDSMMDSIADLIGVLAGFIIYFSKWLFRRLV